MPVLTDIDRQNIIRLIQEGKPMPEHFRNLLFPDDREYVIKLQKNSKNMELIQKSMIT
ncbi:MAG: hypothetical protein MUE70_07080 [Desulfobacterales bacterium]|jgi:hypothetical protein|nr:hypothetical protein [Desulfobacterales bacterium]